MSFSVNDLKCAAVAGWTLFSIRELALQLHEPDWTRAAALVALLSWVGLIIWRAKP